MLVVAGCGAAAAPAPPRATAPPPPRVAQPDPAREYGAPPAPQCTSDHFTRARVDGCKCSGRHQDLHLAGVKCDPAFYRDVHGLLVPRLDAPATVHPGERVTLHVAFHNASPDALPIVTGGDTYVHVLDHTGADVTFHGCGEGFSASGEDYLLVLAGGGDLDLELPWVAAAHDACTHGDWPYPPGQYTLVAGTGPVRGAPVPTVTAAIEVR
jgi:hypothetical protein